MSVGVLGPVRSRTPALVSIPFDHTILGLNEGVEVYELVDGAELLGAWFHVPVAWNGTTPMADVGAFIGGDTVGLLATAATDVLQDLTVPDFTSLGGVAFAPFTGPTTAMPAGILMGATMAPGEPTMLKVVVSQDGTLGGMAAGSTAGTAILYLLVTGTLTRDVP